MPKQPVFVITHSDSPHDGVLGVTLTQESARSLILSERPTEAAESYYWVFSDDFNLGHGYMEMHRRGVSVGFRVYWTEVVE
jgi:hypothetical protein